MLQLARESDWEDVRRLSVQVHNLHVSWRPDLYVHCEEPHPKDAFLEDIRNRMVYVAKLENQVMGYVVLAVKQKDGPGRVPRKILLLDSICVEETVRGHGIGKGFHEEPSVLHYKNNFNCILEEGMCFTIEPMINAGTYKCKVNKKDGWTVTTADKQPSAQYENTLLVIPNGVEVLTLRKDEDFPRIIVH